jgi:hypothetical protein
MPSEDFGSLADKPQQRKALRFLEGERYMDISSIGNLAAHIGAPVEAPSPRPAGEDQRALIQAVKAVNGAGLLGQDVELTLQLVPDSQRTVVRVVNRETREVVDQIPPDSVLRLAQELDRVSGTPSE